MPRTRECDYCGTDIEPGTGTMFVHKDGATTHFCSSKCENNADLGREARNLEWTDTARGEAGEAEDEA
uniref:Large ribosomal subunit protein eL24 n=5 Tax=cellular organisms TaxID=131567 RepID=RL24E_HALMA|nr:RecName: Full=Large ribosomal subunit protein eL24; AltName: Full=50S ribosomal protein L24e; AltName: Full=Hl21/Hl22 [Haloarcula marismortui ATCC 43049]2QA4_U Chain U, 50S ribosomal protein L24e [Haloarcula marismortui]2QEX_U Chain U, 50S ribosomal protein L24e [Haloarcula marismortui]3CC2_U Chain U, 50S ribosomal protein L24e [Haloarcula marismortui]3CC4_U Chain U, 50S ribosomal protein L24e [Haloarcula marismortui]3CC7_U Chain U, 50S ribosomal protein L24e [Haloarcula marismortui]3CCE_U